MSATLPIPPAIRPHLAALLFFAYLAALVGAFASGLSWLEELVAFTLLTFLLWPGLRARSAAAWIVWAIGSLGILALGITDRGDIALDFMPVMVNAALCVVFARTLAPGSEPLIARLIAVLESPERVRLPRVAVYARALTWAWALLLGTQALMLTVLIGCAVPDGLLARYGVTPPIEIVGDDWRWYLQLGSYVGVIAFLVIEYAFRRWYLRHIPHAPLPVFVSRLVRRWPALAHSVMHDVRHDA